MENKIIRNKKNTKKNLKKLLKSENTFSSSAVSEILESCNSSKAVGNDTLTEFNITLNPMLNRGMKDFIENFDFNVLETEEEESSNLEDEEKSLPNDQQSVNLFQFEDEDKTTLRFSNPSSFLSYLKAFSDRSDPETQARIRACISDTAKKFPNSKLFKTRDMREICSKSLKSKRPPKERLKTEITESKSTKSSLKELPMDEKTQRIIYQQLKQVQDNLEKNQSVSSSTSSSSSSSSSSLSSSSVMNGRGKQEGESVLLMGAAQGFYELCQMVLSEDPSCVNDRDKDHTTALMEAADRGHHDVMRLLIHHHADVNARSKAGHTALHYAVSRGRLEAIEVLLNNGADLSVMDNSGHTPLMDAASQGNVPVAKLLVQYGANVNECSMDFKESTLTIAAYKGNKEMVEFLLDQGAEIEHKTDEMHTALLEACIENYTEVVKVLLEKGACVNTISDSCETPLGLAVTSNNDELARLLLEKGANVNERNEEDYTALMEAVQEGNMEMAALLLAYNADIDAMTEGKETALSLACRQRMVAMAGMLALNGANLELGGVTPLMGACKEGCVTLVNFLLKRGADVNTVGTNGDSALTCASEGGHKQVVLMLLQAGAIVDHESDDGSTPLMKAASCGHFEVVHQLHLHGANVNKSTNDNDMTVLSAACNAGHKDIVMYLISHGADTNYKLKDNSTMLMEACKSNHVHVALLLLNCFEESEKIALDASSTEHEEIEKVDGENKEVRQQQLFKQLQNVQQKQIPQQRKHFKPHHTENKAFCCNKQQLIKRCQQLNEEKLQLQQKQQQQQQPAFSDYLHGMSGISKSPPKCVARQGVLCAEEIEKQRLKQNEKVKGGEAKVCACVHDDDDEDDEEDDDDDLTYDLDYLIGMVGNEAWMDKNDEDEEEEDDDDYYEEYPESEHSIMTLKHKNARNEITISSDATSHNNLDFSTAAIIPNVLNASTPAAIAVDHELPDVVSTSNGRDVVDSSDAICGVKVDDVNGGSLVKSKGNENGDVKMNGGDLVERGVDSDISKSFAKNVKNKINNKVNHKHNNEKVNNDSKINKKNEKMLREDGDGCAASRSSSLPQHSPSSSSSASQSSCNSDKFEDARVCFFNNQHNGIEAAVERSESQSSRKKACLDNFDLDSPVNLLSPDLENLKIGNYDENLENYEKSGDNYVKHVGKENKIGDVTAKENDLRAKEMVERNDDDDDTPTLHNPSITNHVVASTVKNESENRNSNNNKEDASMACLMEENESPLSNVIPTASSSQKIAVDAVKQEKKTSKSNLPSHLKYRVIAKGHRKLLPRKPTEPYVGIPAAQNTEVPAPNHSVRPLKEIIVSECPSECLQQYPEFVKLFKEEESKKLQNKVPSPQSNLLNKNMPSDKTTQHKQALLSQQQQQFLKSAMQQKQMDVDKISKIILAKRNQLYDLHKSDCGSCDSNFKKTAKLNNISKRNLRPLQQVNECTESNHDSSLSISCQKGHAKTVILLLERGADVDHVDKKGYTPLLHAAAGGHLKCVEFLLRYGADIEAHTEPSKDTSLSLVCSIGRKDVAELLLQHKANKEHRNSSDYTPLCLAANGGYVPVIKTLFKYDVEINSRTNSRLGISPLMLASMNGHTEAVKLLLSRGGDVNAQIETNRNTALTLACFQGRLEVVSLLLDHKAHIEHRAKKGYTPLMESAHGGYVDVARVLLNRGADLSAVHNNTTRDTALTIAAEKGHCKFVELLLLKGAQVDFRNKKGQTALWLACNGGHLEVVQLLLYSRADPNSKDAREISCLMAALKKGHVKIIKLLIRHVNQYPSDADCDKCLAQVVNNPELERRCRHCISVIDDAKVRQFQAADLNAKNLLLEEQAEKFVLENKRLAAQKKREKKKLKKKNNAKNVDSSVEASKSASNVGICDRITTAVEEDEEEEEEEEEEVAKKVNEQKKSSKNKKNKKNNNNTITSSDANNSNNNNNNSNNDMNNNKNEKDIKSLVENTPNTNNNNTEKSNKKEPCKKNENVSKSKSTSNVNSPKGKSQSRNISTSKETHNSCSVLDSFSPSSSDLQSSIYPPIIPSNSSIGALDDFEKDFKPRVATKTSKSGFTYVDGKGSSKHNKGTKGGLKKVKEEGWQEVSRKCNKLVVPGKSVSRLIGRAGCNINAIREYTKATIDLNKMKNSNDNTALLKGSPESIQLAAKFIEVFIEDVDADIDKIISHHKASNPSFSQNNIQNIPPSKPPTNSSSVSSNSENILIGKTFYPTSNPWKQINTSVKNHTFSDINSSASFGNVSSSDSTTFVNGPTSQPLDTIDTNIAKNELLMNDIAFQYSSICKGIQDNDIENKPLNGEDINVSVSANAINLRNEDLTDFKDPFKSDISKPLPPIPSETPLNSECKFNDKTPVDSLNDLDTTAVYSPFHNHFSAFISARNKENKKNFASVAAASCVETSSFMAPSAHNFPPSSFLNEDTAQSIDSDLQAKAPGFRPAGFTAKPQSPLKKGDKLNSDQFASDDFFAYDPLHCKADEKRNSGIKPLKEFNLLENFSPPESILGYGAKSSILGKNFSNNHLEPKPHALLKPQSSGLNPEAPKFTSSFNTPLQPFSLYDHPSPSFNSFPYFNPQYQNNYNLPKVNLSNYNQNQLGLDRSTNDSNPYNNYLPSQEIFKRPMYQHFDNQNTQDYFSAYQKPFDSPKADKSLFHQNALRNQFSASNNQNRLPIWGQLPNSK